MKDKLIDGLLLVTMIAVAILIVITLFSPSSLRFSFDRGGGTGTATTTRQDASNASGGIVPISPDDRSGANTDSANSDFWATGGRGEVSRRLRARAQRRRFTSML